MKSPDLDSVIARLAGALCDESVAGPPLGRFNSLLVQLLDALAVDPAASRIYLAGPETTPARVAARRATLQTAYVERLVDIFGAHGSGGQFACRALVAATGRMTADALIDGSADSQADALAALRRPLVLFAERSLC